MFCRRAWQRVAPLAPRVFKPATSNAAPVRHLAFRVPGGSFNTTYFALCGGGLAAALVYAYKTINSHTERYEHRLAGMGCAAKAATAAEPARAAEPAPEPDVAEVSTELVLSPLNGPVETSAVPLAAPKVAAEKEASGEAAASAEEAAPPAAAKATSASTLAGGEVIATETKTETQTEECAGTAALDEGGPAAPELAV